VSVNLSVSEIEPGLRITGHWVSDFGRVRSGRVGSRVCVSDPVFEFDPVLSFNIRVYRGVVSIESNTISAS